MVPPTFARSSTGETTEVSIFLTSPQSTICTGRNEGFVPDADRVTSALDVASVLRAGRSHPPRNRATSSSGRCVADSPIRCGAPGDSAASRSSVSARCAPRFVPATAWISSTITARKALNIVRPRTLVSRMCNDSGVVIRIWGVLRSIFARALAGVSPVRTATRISGKRWPACSNRSFSCASGFSRLR